ncbi:nucleoside phosphorylase [Eubacteriales bacterium OttesenSCG-928-N13]|nr:nucleoside phosphorylase [Eubacteriales bacterium OttesenSCG-928-N13]
MSLHKHEIPILEYDTDASAVIMPGHSGDVGKLPEKLVFAFLQDEVDKYAARHDCRVAGWFKTITKEYPVYVTQYQGEEVVLCQAPLGSPAAVQILDELIHCGARKIIAVGSCGALVDLPEGEFLIPSEALRDEGASYHYLPPARWVSLDEGAMRAIEQTLSKRGLRSERVKVWTTDGFFRETKAMVTHRKQEGCQVVDMECAGMAACAQMRGAALGQILFTADTLADIEQHDARDWGISSHEPALMLALDAVIEMG